MLGILIFILLIIAFLFLITFLIEVCAILLVGFLYIVLWQDGLAGQTIVVVVVGLILLIATFPKMKS